LPDIILKAEKNGFAESKNFSWIRIRKIILLNYQNNCVERSNH